MWDEGVLEILAVLNGGYSLSRNQHGVWIGVHLLRSGACYLGRYTEDEEYGAGVC